MSKHMKRSTRRVMLPQTVIADRNVIQLLREERIVVHFDHGDDSIYVKAPHESEIIHEFPMLCVHDTESCERTSIDSLALKRALQQHEFSLEDESDTPFNDTSE
ncbi:hypothetical protein [Halocatena marina]|nr:hypothetical protein [Halocatena marina]